MSNTIKIKRGSGTPSGSDLAVYELGYETGTTTLHINDNGTYRQIGGANTSGSNNQILTDDGSGGINSEGSLLFSGSTLEINNTGDWSYIKNNTNSGGLRLGTKDSGGTFANQIEISNTGNYVKLNENTSVTGYSAASTHFQLNFSGTSNSLLKIVNSGWSNETTHDILFNYWQSNIGDYTYLKSAGNSTSQHGIALVGDTLFAVGDTTVATGAVTNSATAPFTDTWFYVNGNGHGWFKGNVTTSAHLVLPYGEINDSGTDLNIVGTNAITLQSESGTALTVPNASTNVILEGELFLKDGKDLVLGNDSDLQLKSDGSHSYIRNFTGDLYFQQHADDKDIVFQCDDGNGNVSAYLTIDGGANKIIANENIDIVTSSDEMIRFKRSGADEVSIEQDSAQLYFYNRTTSKVLFLMSETGSAKLGYNSNPDLELRNTATSAGSGPSLTFGHSQSGVASVAKIVSYLTDGSQGGRAGHLDFHTSQGGTMSQKFRIDSDGSLIMNAAEKFYLDGKDNTYIHENSADSVYMVVGGQNVMRFYETSNVGYAYAPDNFYVGVGSGIDFTMRHDGNNSYLKNTTGNLHIRGRDDGYVTIDSNDGTESIVCDLKSEVLIKHAGTTVFETLSGGIRAHGKVVCANNTGFISYDAAGNQAAVVRQDTSDILFIGDSNHTEQIKIQSAHSTGNGYIHCKNDGGIGFSGNTEFSSPMVVNYGAVFNEGGHNSDFRVESDNQTNCLLVDASQDRVETYALTDDNTRFGYTSGSSLVSSVNTEQEYADLPIGYSRMMHANLGTDEGMPLDNQHFYFNVLNKRDSGGGWNAIAQGYNSNEEFYIGHSLTNSAFATWSRVVVESSAINSTTGYFQSDDYSTDLNLRRGPNNDDRITIQASHTDIVGDADTRARFGSTVTIYKPTHINHQLYGGFGAQTTGGTADWNHSTNARSGGGHTLLLEDATNGPTDSCVNSSNTTYMHPFSFEYASWNNDGNMTQFGIPYYFANEDGVRPAVRSRYSGTWSAWHSLITGNAAGQIQGSAGTESLPSYSFNGNGVSDLDTGMYRRTTNQIGFTCAGEDQMHIADGTVFIEQPVKIQFANDQRIFDNGSGGLKIGAASHELQFYAGGSDPMQFYTGGVSGTERIRLESGGDCHFDQDVIAFSTTPSDKRLKTNIKEINYGLKTIMKLNPKEYDWKKDDRHDIGFIAQEVEEVIPEIVKDKKHFDENIKTLDYEKLTAVLIKAVQEQQQQINELKEKLNG